MGGECAPAPVVRDWKLIAKLTESQAKKGAETSVRFNQIEPRPLGRIRHLRAIRVVGSVALLGTGTNLALSRHTLLGLVHNIKLSDSEGWNYLDGCDARDIEDSEFFRGGLFVGREAKDAAAVAANVANAATVFGAIDFVIDLATRVPGPGQRERLIPVCALQERDAEAFKFKLKSTLPTTLGAGLSIVNYYQPDNTTLGLQIWGDFVDLDGENVPPRWGLRDYEKFETSSQLDYPEATHLFAVVRPKAEDAALDAGEGTVIGISGVKVTAGGQDVLSNIDSTEWLQRDTYLQKSEPESFAARPTLLGAYGIGHEKAAVSSARTFGILLPPRNRKSAPAGRVTYKLETNPAGKIRVLHEFVMCNDATREAVLRKAGKMQDATRTQLAPATGELVTLKAGTVVDKTGPVMLSKG